MLISELEAQLKELREKHGDLEAMIERPTGCFVSIDKIEKGFILTNLVKMDNEGAVLSGDNFIIIKPVISL